jgi:hypothetical protein
VAVAGWVSHRWTWCGRQGRECSISNASPAMSAGELYAKIIYGKLKGLKHEIFDLGDLTPTKFIWLDNLGIGEKSKFSFKLMLLFAILYFKRMLSICQRLSSICSVYVLRTDRALPIFESI